MLLALPVKVQLFKKVVYFEQLSPEYLQLVKPFFARLDEELLYYPGLNVGVGIGVGGVGKKFNVKVFYVMGKASCEASL